MKLRQKTGVGCREVAWNAQCCNGYGSLGSSCGRSEESKVSKQINMQAGLISDSSQGEERGLAEVGKRSLCPQFL